MKHTTILSVLKHATIHISRTDAEILLATILKKPREWIMSHPDSSASFVNRQVMKRMVKRRKKGLPLAYLTGKKAFYGRDFLVTKDTLIPRPETEQYVPLVQSICTPEAIIVDVGTGTGCIPITLEREQIGSAHIGIDISAAALTIATKNATRLSANVLFLQGNLLEPLAMHAASTDHLIITANLPYLTKEEILAEPTIAHEPRLALDGGANGVALYEHLLMQVKQYKERSSVRIDVIMEINPHQVQNRQALCKRIISTGRISIHQDLPKKDRFVMLTVA